VTPLPASRFDSLTAEHRLRQHFCVAALDAFGDFSKPEIAGLGALIDYIVLTQAGQVPHLKPPRREDPGAALRIDAASRANLELTRSLAGERRGSLQWVIDRTVSPAGARLLSARLANPLAEVAQINARLDEVQYFLEQRELRLAVRARLSAMPDLERALGRLSVRRGGPRDLAAIRDGLASGQELADLLRKESGLSLVPAPLQDFGGSLAQVPAALAARLAATLGESLPPTVRDGGFVKPGVNAELDRLATGPLCRGDRHQVAQDSAQQYSWLFHRGRCATCAATSGRSRELPAPPNGRQCDALYNA
jgi:DNA mismatch repair protein MutS